MSTLTDPTVIADLHRDAALVADIAKHCTDLHHRYNPRAIGATLTEKRATYTTARSAVEHIQDAAQLLLTAQQHVIDVLTGTAISTAEPAVSVTDGQTAPECQTRTDKARTPIRSSTFRGGYPVPATNDPWGSEGGQ